MIATSNDIHGGVSAAALLAEIAQLLAIFVRDGEAASIDLRSLPVSVGELERLRVALGQGAIAAEVEAGGVTRVRETLYPGVWWVTHFDEQNEPIADLIEICSAPEILLTPIDDASEGLRRLQRNLADSYEANARSRSELA